MSPSPPAPHTPAAGPAAHAAALADCAARRRLRAAGLSQYFTQDLEDMLLLPPSGDASETAKGADSGARVRLCTERQRQVIRALLGRAGQTEDWLLAKLHLERLDEVPYERAEQVIRRLSELARDRS